MGRGVFAGCVVGIIALGILQSATHLLAVLVYDHINSIVDLDRSNSLPDVLSTTALAAATLAAAVLAREGPDGRSVFVAMLTVALGLLTLADLGHHGPHPASSVGWVVIATVVGTGALLAGVAASTDTRPRATLAVAGCLLLGSFFVNSLDRLDAERFERERGDPIAERQIAAKEGLELVGWSLVALALWDEASRRRSRSRRAPATARASRARAASRRRAA